MPITPEEARTLVDQQKIAHKLLAGFYQNILASFDRLTKHLGYTFIRWWPTLTSRPCHTGTNPSSKWIWDFLPLYASTFVYNMQGEPTRAQPGNCVLVFRLYCDDGFKQEYRQGYIDPVDMKSKEGSVDLMVYRCIKSSSKSCYDLYNACNWPTTVDVWEEVGHESMRAYLKRYFLEDFITKEDDIKNELVQLITSRR